MVWLMVGLRQTLLSFIRSREEPQVMTEVIPCWDTGFIVVGTLYSLFVLRTLKHDSWTTRSSRYILSTTVGSVDLAVDKPGS